IRLLDVTTGRQWRAAIEHPDVVEPEEATLENILSVGVFAIHPPCKIQQQLMKHPFKKDTVADAFPLFVDLVDTPGRPGMDWRIDVAERPFVGRTLSVGMHVPFAQHQDE